MKKVKIALIIAAALVILVAGVVVFVLTNINSIVKAAIERFGSQTVKTDVRVSSVNIRLTTGEGSIRGLTVANPRGFSSCPVFRLGTISTRIDVRSVTASPVVIDDISISGPEVFFEMNEARESNLGVLKKDLQESSPSRKPVDQKKAGKKETRLFIRKLVFENGKIDVRIASLGGKNTTVSLPRIELTEIGKKGGATPAQVAQIVITALAEEAAKAVARTEGERYLKNRGGDLLKRYMRK